MAGFFRLQPSNIFSALLFSGYSLAFLVVFMLPIVISAKILCALIMAFALYYYLRRDAWLMHPSSPVAMRIEGKEITLLSRCGQEMHGQISAGSLVTPTMTILNVVSQSKKGRHYVVIFPDSMDKEKFRELRVLLKWGI